VNAVPGEVQLPADEPGRPFDPAGGVHHLLPRLGELEAEILDDRRPEPLRLLHGDAVERVVAVHVEPPREAGQVRGLDPLGVGPPDEISH
jgi:hypothetical protein